MSEVKRYGICGFEGGVIELKDGHLVHVDDFDRVTAERDAALRQVETITADRDAEKQMKAKARIQRDVQTAKAADLQERLTAADERADVLEGLLWEYIDRDEVTNDWAREWLSAVNAALKPAASRPCPVSLDGCDGSCAP